MDQFIAKRADKLQGTLSGFDRVLFRGDRPFSAGMHWPVSSTLIAMLREMGMRFWLEQAEAELKQLG
jgi:hypothetical protein